MKKNRSSAWLLLAIGAGACMVSLSGFTANAVAKPKMPSLPRISGILSAPLSTHVAALQPSLLPASIPKSEYETLRRN